MGLSRAQARNSLHGPSNADEEDELLIYNYQPHFTGKHKYSGEEVRPRLIRALMFGRGCARKCCDGVLLGNGHITQG